MLTSKKPVPNGWRISLLLRGISVLTATDPMHTREIYRLISNESTITAIGLFAAVIICQTTAIDDFTTLIVNVYHIHCIWCIVFNILSCQDVRQLLWVQHSMCVFICLLYVPCLVRVRPYVRHFHQVVHALSHIFCHPVVPVTLYHFIHTCLL